MRAAYAGLALFLLALALPAEAQRAALSSALPSTFPPLPAAKPAPAKSGTTVARPTDTTRATRVLVPLTAPPSAAGSLWDQSIWDVPDRGFLWYPPDAPPPELAEPEPAKPRSIRDLATLEEVEKELRRLRSEAIMNPTAENVREYLDAQVYVMDKSAVFADMARRASWTEPELAYTARMPVANSALGNFRDRRAQSEQALLATLGRDHGLVFLFRGDCPFCKDQAPVLRFIQSRYQIPVMAISLDGGAIKEFPDAKPDNGIAMLLSDGKGVNMVPAIYLVHRETRASTPIGFGVMAADEILKRIRVLTSTAPGEEF